MMRFVIFLCCLALLHGCAHLRSDAGSLLPEAKVTGLDKITPELEQKILALNPESISEDDVATVLSMVPAPRIITINGSLPLVTMDSFSRFLILMGYPEDRLRNPMNGAYSYSSFTDSRKLAGMIAWHYERDGLMPMLIGHSQGGMLAIRVLYELSGDLHSSLTVWNPSTDSEENRLTIIDPLSRGERPVTGLTLRFVSAISTGKLMRVLLGQWDMLGRLRRIPDTVEEFTGYHISGDILGGTVFGLDETNRYQPTGKAAVRNILLPSSYSHITIPLTEDLARNTETRKWIAAYSPSADNPMDSEEFGEEGRNILFAADLWHNIKKHWCRELQQLVLTQQAKQGELTAHAR